MTNDQPETSLNRIRNATSAFVRLREEAIAEDRQNYERARYVNSLQRKEREEQVDAAQQLLVQTGLNLDHLDRLEATEERLRRAFVEEVRPALVEHPYSPEARIHGRISQAILHRGVGDTPTLLGADVSTLAPADGDANTVWLYDAEQIKDLKYDNQGHGWGCKAGLSFPVDWYAATWWYSWRPPEDGLYLFVVQVEHSGFVIARADDRWYNCKEATAIAYATARVHQDHWLEGHRQEVIRIDSGNVQEASRLDGAAVFVFTESLQANPGDEMFIRVVFAITTDAWGGGSYAELNFADGEANYLSAPRVFISRWPPVWPG